jgi:cobalt-zinc-cadmium efflux system protein
MAHAHGRAGDAATPSRPGARAVEARRADSARRMRAALGLNLAMLVVEVVGGLLTGSLALLADAGHLASDVAAIGVGLLAGGLAARPAGPRRTFGYQRSEIVGALANGLGLVVIAVLVVIAAVDRLGDPPELDGAGVLAVGLVGLAGNLAASWVLARGDRSDVNLEGVLRHSAADALGSLGVVVAGAVVLTTGWRQADPIASLLISALILASSWRLIREPFDVLMEAAPEGVDVESLGREMCAVPSVLRIHDLHVWTVTSGFDALAAHVVVERGADRDLIQRKLELVLRERYGIEHTTLQMEEEGDDAPLQLEGLPPPS